MSRRRRRRSRAKFIVPIVSMGDIAFLLIIFFMLCSNFAREAGINVTPAVSVDIESVEESELSVTIDEESAVHFQGRKLDSADALETELAEILGKATSDKARRVLFKCDRDVDRLVFEPVMDAITRAGGTIVAVGEKHDKANPKDR